MVMYRRNFVPGGTYFFTVTLRNRKSRILVDHVDLLRDVYRSVCQKQPFETVAIVILPDHIHAIWKLPDGDTDYSRRWHAIKSGFTRGLKALGASFRLNNKGEHCLWQSRFWEHTIRDEHDLQRHIDYIHYNPVKHGLAEDVRQWGMSSFHKYVMKGLYPEDWAGGAWKDVEVTGE